MTSRSEKARIHMMTMLLCLRPGEASSFTSAQWRQLTLRDEHGILLKASKSGFKPMPSSVAPPLLMPTQDGQPFRALRVARTANRRSTLSAQFHLGASVLGVWWPLSFAKHADSNLKLRSGQAMTRSWGVGMSLERIAAEIAVD